MSTMNCRRPALSWALSLVAMWAISAGAISCPVDSASTSKQCAAGLGAYPLTTCPISGGALGTMGESVVRTYDVSEGHQREVRFCCAGCIEKFEADLQANLTALEAQMVDSLKASYPLTVCPISGGELGAMGEPIDHMHGDRLVRFCCAGCVAKFEADPDQYLQKICAAAKAAGATCQAAAGCCPKKTEAQCPIGAPPDDADGTEADSPDQDDSAR
jgi:hypothetical protein